MFVQGTIDQGDVFSRVQVVLPNTKYKWSSVGENKCCGKVLFCSAVADYEFHFQNNKYIPDTLCNYLKKL